MPSLISVATQGQNLTLDSPGFYAHEALPTEEHTRFLILDPGAPADGLSCDLQIGTLDEAKDSYVALSYVWGDATKVTHIRCHGQLALITVNLAEALRALRHPHLPRRVWADAICINQADNVEKSQQVKRIGKVFHNAKEVVVWLGADHENIAVDCFSLITETTSYLDDQLVTCGNTIDIPTLVKPYPISSDISRWDKVRKLLALPWFARVWVIPEAGLAKICTLRWGPHETQYARIIELALWYVLREDLAEITGPLNALRLTNVFRDIHLSYENEETWTTSLPLLKFEFGFSKAYRQIFLDILMAASGMLASDKRDYVFAFLGTSPACQSDGRLLAEPDYNKELSNVFYEMACGLLGHPREAPYLLSHVKHKASESLYDPDFPSWLPRWDRPIDFSISRPKFWYRAGGTDVFEPEIQKDKTLAVQGVIFDSISFVSRRIHVRNFSKEASDWDEEYLHGNKPFIDVLWEEVLEAAKPTDVVQFEREFAWTLSRAYPATPGKISKEQNLAEFAAYRRLIRCASNAGKHDDPDKHSVPGGAAFPRNFLHRLHYTADLRVAVMKSGRLGYVLLVAQPGDHCVVFPGVPVPMTLRLREGNRYAFVGESYINGAMGGEVIGDLARGRLQKETLILV